MSYAIDKPEIQAMERQLQVDTVERVSNYVGNIGSDHAPSYYVQTSLEEFSRNYHTVSVAPSMPPVLDTIDYHANNAAHLRFPEVEETDTFEEFPQLTKGGLYDQSRFLQNYHPHSSPQQSTFRRVPVGNKHLVDNCAYGYTKLLVSIGPKEKIRYGKHHIMEPIFGTACLYSMSSRDGELTKITETFNFDATPQSMRSRFKSVYRAHFLDEEGIIRSEADPLHINPIHETSKCLFSFPTELLATDIYLVIELSKVLTGEPDKALLPYIHPDKKSLFATDQSFSITDTCRRLRKYRQPLGISVVKVFNPDGQVYQNVVTPGASILSVFALKNCQNEAGLKQHIQDMFPPEGSSQQIRLDITELDIGISMYCLGSDSLEKVSPPEGLFPRSDDTVADSDLLFFLPSQYHSEAEAEDTKWFDHAGGKLAVRCMLPLPPTKSMLSDNALRGIRSTLDHTIFLYPTAFENFQRRTERNLCLEVQLIEFLETEFVPSKRSYTVLNNIYSNVPGYMYCQSACTRVSYHKASPELNDEIKIRLPLPLTKNHFLLFHIYHVHVKGKKTEHRGSIGGFFAKKGEDSGEVCSLIGHCYLPLLSEQGCMLPDGEYVIPVHDDTAGGEADDRLSIETRPLSVQSTQSLSSGVSFTPSSIASSSRPQSSQGGHRRSGTLGGGKSSLGPTITLRTRAFSSFMSSHSELQRFLATHPPRLGALPSLTQQQLQSLKPRTPTRGTQLSNIIAAAVRQVSNSTSTGGGADNTEAEMADSMMFLLDCPSRSSGRRSDASESSLVTSSGRSDASLRVEICRHFPGIMRHLTRTMCGGTCVCHPRFVNPYCHSNLRCVSFLAMLHVFEFVAPNVVESSEDEATDAEFLRSYVEYVFDEEVCLPTRGANSSDQRKSLSKKSKVIDLVRRQATAVVSEEELIDNMVEHAIDQAVLVIYQGALLSAVGKATNEILSGRLQSESGGERWWRGYTNDKSVLQIIEMNGRGMTQSSKVNPLKEPVVVTPQLPRYSHVDGFIVRRLQLIEVLSEASTEEKKSPSMQWWPWMYEVLVHQWCALLRLYDDTTTHIHAEVAIAEEEGEEDETGDDNQDEDNSEWVRTDPYPFSLDDAMFCEFKGSEAQIRSLATKHGPILLGLIVKSISLRIVREHKNAPVIMDEEFVTELELLMEALGREVHTRKRSLLPCRRLAMAISHFFRELYALVAPLQVARVIYAYMLSSRKKQKQNQESTLKVQTDYIVTRINFLRELCRTDHFFAMNFPLHIGESHDAYVFNPIFSTKELLNRASGSSIRGIKNPPHHWLIHLVIYEIMADYSQLEKNLKEDAIKMLRELAVRLCYDARFQSGEYKHRIAAMFLPLLHCIAENADRLYELSVGTEERREELALVLFIIQECPEFLLREEWRQMSKPRGTNPIVYKKMFSADSSIAGDSRSNKLPIFNIIKLLHLILDTFELPLSDGGEKGDAKCVLSPGVSVDDIDGASSNTGMRNKSSNSISKDYRGTTERLQELEDRVTQRAAKPYRRTRAEKGEKRNWKKSVKSTATITKNRTGVDMVSLMRSFSAAKHVNHESTMCVLRTLSTVVEECPRVLQPMSSRYGDNTFNDSCREFMSATLHVMLHALNSKQSEIAICLTYASAEAVLKTYGAPAFIRTAGDSFQFWMRSTLLACCSMFAALRLSATRFIFTLMLSHFQWEGNFTPVATTLLAVLRDVIESIVLKYRSNENMIQTTAHLLPIFSSISVMRDFTKSPSSDRGFGASLDCFLSSMTSLIHVFNFINVHLQGVVAFDWEGANMLDKRDGKDDLVSREFNGVDVNSMMDRFVSAADVLWRYNLPRLKMYVYENLSKIHDLLGNPAESAMIRWEIFVMCEELKHHWADMWAPKPPLKWVRRASFSASSTTYTHFMAALNASLAKPPLAPWASSNQHRRHTITSLSVSADMFRKANLLYLSERSLLAMIGMYRSDADNNALISSCYEKLSKMFSDISVGNMKFAMGTFFRVLYIGQGVPERLRNKEFIVRNGNYLHVSEFQALIKCQLQLLVGEKVPVSVLPDTSPVPPEDSVEAYAYMTSVTPVFKRGDPTLSVPARLEHWNERITNLATENEYSTFQFSVPFTKEGKAHAKSIDLQWKRTTVLHVPRPFPYVLTRQVVCKREVRDLTPIEVAIDDINERIQTMNDELKKKPSKAQSDINNLMRLVQGTVAPQVNAGAAEVARVFLPNISLSSAPTRLPGGSIVPTPVDTILHSHRESLKTSLVEFLRKSRLILEKYRQLTAPFLAGDSNTTSPDSKPPLQSFPSGTSDTPSSKHVIEKYHARDDVGAESSSPILSEDDRTPTSSITPALSTSVSTNNAMELVWLVEMEKGYDLLVDSIYPHVSDISVVSRSRTLFYSQSNISQF